MTLIKYLTIMCLLVLFGVGLTACSSMPTWLVGAKDKIDSLVQVHAPGTYGVTFTKDGKVLYAESWDCTVEAGKTLPECRQQKASPVAPNAVVTPVK